MRLADVRTWVFDLDNTLYPVGALYEEIGARMTAFIAEALGLAPDAALALRERYFHQYGATVCGVVAHHGVEARAFLDYTHDVDYSVVAPDAELNALIARLPGRKIVFTNGGGGHALRTLARLELSDAFEHVFDIEAAGIVPKPEPEAYRRMMAACAVAPRGAVLVEDTLKNLEPAHDLGFHTVLVGAVHPEPHVTYVDAWAPDVKTLLRDYLGA